MTITPDNALPGVPQFLAEAREAGIKIGLGSASKNATEVLEKLQLRNAFDIVGDGYSVVNSKPAPDLFVWVAGGLHTPPNEAVVFEDAEAGIDAALAGGFWAVGLGSANVKKAHLTANGIADLTVQTVLSRMS
jgi:HAD superfamily hydrolase (TIGR01509 family)